MSYGDSVLPGAGEHAQAPPIASRARSIAFERFSDALAVLLLESHRSLRERFIDASDRSINEASTVRYAIYRCMREFIAAEHVLRQQVLRRLAAGIERTSTSAAATSPAGMEFQLMDDGELEEAVLCATLTAASDSASAEALRLLTREVAEPGGEYAAHLWVDELRPRALLQCYLLEANKMVRLEPEARIEVLRSFEHSVLARLPAAYLDAARAARGKDLDVRHAPVQAPPPRSKPAPPDTPSIAGTASQVQRSALDDVLAVLAGRHKQKGLRQGTPALDRDELAHALHTFQWQARSRRLAEVWADCEGRLAEVVGRAVELDRGRPLVEPLNEADQATADLVDLVFDFLAPPGDRRRPDDCRLVVRSLKLPFLRLALLDRNALVDPASPARRLMEGAANLAEEAEEAQQDPRILSDLMQVAREVWLRFDSDPGVFAAILENFLSRADPVRRVAEKKERRMVERLEARDRLMSAWRDVATHLHPERLRRLPELVASVLARPVAQHLVLLHLRGGARPTADYEAALGTWGQVLDAYTGWASGGMPPAEKRHGAMRALAQAAGWLRQALSSVGYTDSDKITLWRALCEFTMGGTRGNVHDYVRATGPDVVEALDGFGLALPRNARSQPVREEQMPATGQPMDSEGVSVGQWVEVPGAGESGTARLKLCWRSRFTHLNIFVDRSGRQALELTDVELSKKLRAGVLRPMSRGISVEGALRTILTKAAAAP